MTSEDLLRIPFNGNILVKIRDECLERNFKISGKLIKAYIKLLMIGICIRRIAMRKNGAAAGENAGASFANPISLVILVVSGRLVIHRYTVNYPYNLSWFTSHAYNYSLPKFIPFPRRAYQYEVS